MPRYLTLLLLLLRAGSRLSLTQFGDWDAGQKCFVPNSLRRCDDDNRKLHSFGLIYVGIANGGTYSRHHRTAERRQTWAWQALQLSQFDSVQFPNGLGAGMHSTPSQKAYTANFINLSLFTSQKASSKSDEKCAPPFWVNMQHFTIFTVTSVFSVLSRERAHTHTDTVFWDTLSLASIRRISFFALFYALLNILISETK